MIGRVFIVISGTTFLVCAFIAASWAGNQTPNGEIAYAVPITLVSVFATVGLFSWVTWSYLVFGGTPSMPGDFLVENHLYTIVGWTTAEGNNLLFVKTQAGRVKMLDWGKATAPGEIGEQVVAVRLGPNTYALTKDLAFAYHRKDVTKERKSVAAPVVD